MWSGKNVPQNRSISDRTRTQHLFLFANPINEGPTRSIGYFPLRNKEKNDDTLKFLREAADPVIALLKASYDN